MGKPESLWTALSSGSVMIGVGAVMGGIASASIHGNAELLPATICILFVIFTQLACNAYIHYRNQLTVMDLTIHDAMRVARNRPGYDRLLFYRAFGFGLGLLAFMVGITIVGMGGLWFGIIGAFILLFIWLMIGGDHPFVQSPWGPVWTFIIFGPVTVISTSMIESMHEATDPLSWFDIAPPLYMSVTIGLLASNAYIAFTYANYFTRTWRRDTFPVVAGPFAARVVFLVSGFVACGVFVWSCFAIGIDYPWIASIPGFVTLPLNTWIWWKMKTLPEEQLLSIKQWASFMVLVMGLLATVVAAFVGIPDDSHLQIF